MRPLRSRWARGVVVWTFVLLLVAIVLAVSAMAGLLDAQQACLSEFPSVDCPDGQDWRVGLLAFAFFGVPPIWLVGVVVAIGPAVANRQRERRT
jgi:hypothetical protein